MDRGTRRREEHGDNHEHQRTGQRDDIRRPGPSRERRRSRPLVPKRDGHAEAHGDGGGEARPGSARGALPRRGRRELEVQRQLEHRRAGRKLVGCLRQPGRQAGCQSAPVREQAERTAAGSIGAARQRRGDDLRGRRPVGTDTAGTGPTEAAAQADTGRRRTDRTNTCVVGQRKGSRVAAPRLQQPHWIDTGNPGRAAGAESVQRAAEQADGNHVPVSARARRPARRRARQEPRGRRLGGVADDHPGHPQERRARGDRRTPQAGSAHRAVTPGKRLGLHRLHGDGRAADAGAGGLHEDRRDHARPDRRPDRACDGPGSTSGSSEAR